MIFEINDKTGRTIQLKKERWQHIISEHPEAAKVEEIKITLQQPIIIIKSHYDSMVGWYYHYQKKCRRYLFVAVKYLNTFLF